MIITRSTNPTVRPRSSKEAPRMRATAASTRISTWWPGRVRQVTATGTARPTRTRERGEHLTDPTEIRGEIRRGIASDSSTRRRENCASVIELLHLQRCISLFGPTLSRPQDVFDGGVAARVKPDDNRRCVRPGCPELVSIGVRVDFLQIAVQLAGQSVDRAS